MEISVAGISKRMWVQHPLQKYASHCCVTNHACICSKRVQQKDNQITKGRQTNNSSDRIN